MNYDAIVVGGGAAGLTTAAYLKRAGRSVALFEKQPKLGGLVQTISRQGFKFDTGLRAIEDAGIILPMFSQLGIQFDYVESPVSLGIDNTIIQLNSERALPEYEFFLKRFFPENKADIEAIIKVIRKVMRYMDVLYGIENPLFKNLKSDYRYFFGTLLPWMVKYVLTIGKISKMDIPVEEYLSGLTSNQSLIDIISQHFFKRTPASFAMSYFSIYLDYLYPKGGTGTLNLKLIEYLKSPTVHIQTNREIKAIQPADRTVTDSTGDVWSYKFLVWCADQRALYEMTDTANLAEKERETIQNHRKKIRSLKGGDSVYSLFIGSSLPPDYFARISSGHLFYTPSPEGVGEFEKSGREQNVEALKNGSGTLKNLKQWLDNVFARTTYEISIPALKDSFMAPEGSTGLIVSILFDYELMKRIYERGWYEKIKTYANSSIIRVIDAKIYPGLKDNLLFTDASTPLTIERYTGNTDGAITGWAFTNPEIPAIKSTLGIAKSVETHIPRVLQAGQWVFSPSGFPIALLTGKLAADKIIKLTKD